MKTNGSEFARIKNFFDELEYSEKKQYFIITLVVIIVGLTGFFYWYNKKITYLHKEIIKVNRQRTEAREILEKHALVQQQKIEVDEVLSQDKTFKIKEFFSQISNEMGLYGKLSKEPEISDPQDLDNGYSEIKLDASFTKMNMKELADLMYNIEKNRRIYTKELVIIKVQPQTIDVTLVIATLQPKT